MTDAMYKMKDALYKMKNGLHEMDTLSRTVLFLQQSFDVSNLTEYKIIYKKTKERNLFQFYILHTKNIRIMITLLK